jgi:GAF domain-containing protein
MQASIPANEAQRLQILRECKILDTPPEEAFDSIAQLASYICRTPIALVTLVDEARQWFKARVGLQAAETPREISFCAHTILQSELLMVPDTTQDKRFDDNPLVTSAPRIRFYAGAPPGPKTFALDAFARAVRDALDAEVAESAEKP